MRPLTVGLVLTITLIGFSSLAVETILPIVSDELGGVSLYAWVFSAFFLGSLASVIVAGGISDPRGTLLPYRTCLSLLALRPAIAATAAALVVAVAWRRPRRMRPAGRLPGTPSLGAAVLVRGLLTCAFFGTEAFLPLMLREARGLSPAIAGVVLTTGGLTWTSGSWVHARVAPRLTSRAIISTAFALVAIGAAGVLAVLLVASVPVELAYLAWAVSGAGIGFGYAAISVLVLRLAPAGRTGATSAAMQVLDNLGTSLGTGAGGAAIAIAVSRGLAIETGIAAAFGVAIAGGVVGLAVSRRLDASRPSVIAEADSMSAPSLAIDG